MNHTTAAAEIKRAWLTAWTGGPLAAMPVEQDNLPFQQPVGQAWARLSIANGETTKPSLGPPMTRTPFILQLQVFLPEQTGTRKATQAADALAVLNGTVTRSNGLIVRFYEAGVERGPDETGTATFLVSLPGTYDIDPNYAAPVFPPPIIIGPPPGP